MQTEDGEERPVAYLSKAFDERESRWCTGDQESFAVVYAVDKWRHYLMGKHFVLETDHNNLVHLFSGSSPKLQRQWHRVIEFDFQVKHVPGKLNVVADHLSRHLPEDEAMSEAGRWLPAHHALALAGVATRSKRGGAAIESHAGVWGQGHAVEILAQAAEGHAHPR